MRMAFGSKTGSFSTSLKGTKGPFGNVGSLIPGVSRTLKKRGHYPKERGHGDSRYKQELIPHLFQPSFFSKTNRKSFSTWVDEGSVERSIPGKNGEGTPRLKGNQQNNQYLVVLIFGLTSVWLGFEGLLERKSAMSVPKF